MTFCVFRIAVVITLLMIGCSIITQTAADISLSLQDPSACRVESIDSTTEDTLAILKHQTEARTYYVGSFDHLGKISGNGLEIMASQWVNQRGQTRK